MKFKGEIIIISGPRDAGKTNLCLKLVERLTSTGKMVRGIVSPGLYQDSRKMGILARDVATGEETQFAKYSLGWDIQRPEREWRFLTKGITWVNSRLQTAVPTDILFIDEIGYLEMEEKGGWTAALKNLDQGQFNHAILVIRPDLLEKAHERWKIQQVLIINPDDNLDEFADRILNYLIDKA